MLGASYGQLCDAIIRPPRASYQQVDLGPETFRVGRKLVQRTDLQIQNKRGQRLECSHFEPHLTSRASPQLPCVIYCHGNCGCRMDVIADVNFFLEYNITVFCFDFSGSGLSEGDWVSLGFFEQDDLEAVVNHLRNTGTVSKIALWGRSMGAATSILYGVRDPSIAGMVLDSPFASLTQLATELVESSQFRIPKMMVSLAFKMIRRSIQHRAGFDVLECEPIKYVDQCFIPALFAHGSVDTFIGKHHSEQLFDKYGGDKNKIFFDGDHNSPRPEFFYDSLIIFFHNVLLDSTPINEATLHGPKSFFPDFLPEAEFREARTPRASESTPRASGGTPRSNSITSSQSNDKDLISGNKERAQSCSGPSSSSSLSSSTSSDATSSSLSPTTSSSSFSTTSSPSLKLSTSTSSSSTTKTNSSRHSKSSSKHTSSSSPSSALPLSTVAQGQVSIARGPAPTPRNLQNELESEQLDDIEREMLERALAMSLADVTNTINNNNIPSSPSK